MAFDAASSACCTRVCNGGHLLIERTLQHAHLILQLGDIALHFLLFAAGGEGQAHGASSSGSRSERRYQAASSLPPVLLTDREMGAAVALPAGFVGFGADRPLFAIADGFEPIGRHAQLHQKVFGRSGSAVAQAEIVFGRTALVAVSFHGDGGVGEIGEDALERIGVGRQGGPGVVANVVGIVIVERIRQIGLTRDSSVPLFCDTDAAEEAAAGAVTVTVAVAVALPGHSWP